MGLSGAWATSNCPTCCPQKRPPPRDVWEMRWVAYLDAPVRMLPAWQVLAGSCSVVPHDPPSWAQSHLFLLATHFCRIPLEWWLPTLTPEVCIGWLGKVACSHDLTRWIVGSYCSLDLPNIHFVSYQLLLVANFVNARKCARRISLQNGFHLHVLDVAIGCCTQLMMALVYPYMLGMYTVQEHIWHHGPVRLFSRDSSYAVEYSSMNTAFQKPAPKYWCYSMFIVFAIPWTSCLPASKIAAIFWQFATQEVHKYGSYRSMMWNILVLDRSSEVANVHP